MINKIIEELFIKNGIEDIKVSKSNRPDLCDYQSNDIFKKPGATNWTLSK